MAMILQKICNFFVNLVRPARRPTRVSFSPSTLHREILRQTELSSYSNPFFNFLAEVRLKAQGSQSSPNGAHQLSTRESMRLSKAAGQLWKCMSDDEKLPYRNIATEQRRLKRLRRHPRKRKRSLSLQHRKRNRSELDLSNDLQ